MILDIMFDPSSSLSTLNKSNKINMFRYYPSQYPKIDEVVMIEINSINEVGALVTLLEYNGIQGMIPLLELTKRRFKSLGKLAKVGKHDPAVVLRVDLEKTYIDLSRRRVSPEEAVLCDDRFQKAKIVQSIINQISTKAKIGVDRLYESLAWPLANIYGTAFDAFQFMGQFPEEVFRNVDGQTAEIVRFPLREAILQKMTIQATRIRYEIEMTSFSYDGLIVIQEACRVTRNLMLQHFKGKIEWKIVAAPLYALTAIALYKGNNDKILMHILEECKVALASHNGNLRISATPTNLKSIEEFSQTF